MTVAPGATVTPVQTSGGANPSFTNIRVGGGSLVNNAGTITNPAGQARDNFGVNLAGDLSTLNNTGTISLVAPAGNATTRLYGAYSSAPNGAQYASTTVTNAGTIGVVQNGNGIARGIYSGENTTLFTITNTGLISATRAPTATATTALVAGVDSDDDTDRLVVNNAAGGRITATGVNTRAINGRAADLVINNSGTIQNTTAGEAAIATYALNAGNAGDATTPRAYSTTLTNTATGVVSGDVRLFDQDLQTGATLVNLRRSGTVANAGTITGTVAFGGGNAVVTNTGRIGGSISFLDVAGTVNAVSLGTGSSIGGNITARGLGTNTLTLSGTGTLTGAVTGFTSLTQAGGAWTTGAGSTQALSGNLTVAGGTLTLGAGSTQTVGGVVQVTGSGAQLTVANTLTNKAVNLSGSNTTVVNLGTITGTGAAGRTNTAANRVYGVLANSTGADFSNVAVVNQGTIAVTENGIGVSRGIYAGENIASMSVVNAGTISATRASTSTGTAAVAAIDSDDDVASLTVTNQAGGRISATGTGTRAIQGRAQSFTIANAGTIAGPAGGQAIVVYGNGTATLTNAATGTIGGDVRFTDSDPQVATSTARRNSSTTNAGRIDGSLLYGMGSHALANTGTITGGITLNDVAASRNTITLGTGSVIQGNIVAQGRGRNALVLTGAGTLASNVSGFTTLSAQGDAYTLAAGTTQSFSGGATVAGGSLTVNSMLSADTQVAAGGTLLGTGRIGGTLTNGGTVAPGNATAAYGTLSVTGAFAQTAGATLSTAVAATGEAARLSVDGTATLAGTASLVQAAGQYRPGTRYTLVTAQGGITGGFSAVTTSNALPTLIRAVASSDATNAYVTLAQQSFGLVARTQNQAGAARGLDAALAGNTGALTTLDYQSDGANAALLDRVAGQGYASVADLQLRAGRAFADQLVQRGYTAIFEPGQDGFTLPPAVYAADLPQRGPVPEARFVPTNRGYGVWATGYGQFGTVDGTANAAGRTETIAGFAGGIDAHTQPGTVLGIAAGYGSVDVGLSRTGERAHTDNAQIGVYGGITSGTLYGTLALGYSHAEGRMDRSVGGGILQPNGARGTLSGDQFLAAGEAGARVALAPGQALVPFVGFQVATFDQDRVTERGNGPFNLNVAAQDFLSARTLVGARAEGSLTLGERVVSLGVKAAYVHDFADVARTIQSSFALAPTVPFRVNGRRLDRDRALVGVGIASVFAAGWTGFVNYDAELAASDTIQAVRGGVRYAF
ncbi:MULTISPECIES: autotransporter outer membrane beta-barrel domain-containing protein [Methylobacterium]|uniref:autotransporter outer membrane beta-barrel domain-containing protein n=1 Tax=Methylobacterium TaxID=407 RepID=UPI0012E7D6D2|nr:autotransporter outer membrane beta-barrel domain-containing protein [Methylobacterium sp. Leaf104]MCI9881773.1 autotransporter domain-containing protein [Methylobacterium goesingense]